MKIALVHDYLREFGGAERVLEALSEIYPDSPIYTAFVNSESEAYRRFKHKKIITSWAQNIPFFATKLHSPLRFLAPFIWGSFQKELNKYDVVISSAAWYITKGFGSRHSGDPAMAGDSRIDSGSSTRMTIEICYCHTPPRWLYGYKTAIEWQKYWPVKVYATIIGHFMRMYDFSCAQKVNYFVANSNETKKRIEKFYRRGSTVVYPPVSLPLGDKQQATSNKKRDYYFVVARLVGAKGLEIAVEAAIRRGFKLKIAGVSSGYSNVYKELVEKSQENIEFLGYVSDEELVELYANAKAFLALSTDEDFGITPVEAMLCGTPVIAFRGGGYVETVVEGKTGVFFDTPTSESLVKAIEQFEKSSIKSSDCIQQAKKFSKTRFIKEIKEFVSKAVH